MRTTADGIDRAVEVLYEPGAVVELRAFGERGTVSGYFADREALIREAERLDASGHAVYLTLNEVNPDLLARASNRARKVFRDPTTSDNDIVRRRWFPLDFDPKRPSGVSATDTEKKEALRRAREVREYLRTRGWPEPVVADSGNGAHLLYRLDLPNDRRALEVVRGALEALSFSFSDEVVEVDTSVHNAARIWKAYGSTARKGDDTPDRPHRRSELLRVPATIEVVGQVALEAVASMRPPPRPRRNGQREFDLGAWIGEHGVPVKREGTWGADGRKYVLAECPWNGHADGAAFIVQFADGAVAAGCHHNSCRDYGWQDLRLHYEPDAYGGNDKEIEDLPVPKPVLWPTLASEAYHGLAGDIARAIGPHTEADPVAVLANVLVAYGNAIGRGAFFRVGADEHHLKLNVAMVGATSKGRKGQSEGYVRVLMRAADAAWEEERVLSGLSSGEGLIHEVRDEVWGVDGDGIPVLKDGGVADKRLLVSEPELARVLKVMNRETNTLSPIVRQAWDGGRLRVMTRTNPLKATDAHVSVVGHVSKEELLRHLTETEAASGFANRFCCFMVRRSKELPFGGDWHTVDAAPLIKRLSEALEFGKSAGEITWGESAKATWREVYGPLSEGKSGLFGAVVGRAEAQTVRLAVLYAVIDRSRTIEFEHLAAALALWEYAEESARFIFGDATGDPVADRVANALRSAGEGGMSRTEIRDLFGRLKGADRIDRALALLLRLGRVRRVRRDTGGRPSERWFLK